MPPLGIAPESSTDESIEQLYTKPLPASRSGPIFSCFSYPTKISAESIAVFIATHTNPGDVVLDVFGGSGSTAIAALLCSEPPKGVTDLAKKMGVRPQWGPRRVVSYELSSVGSLITRVLTNAPHPQEFKAAALALLSRVRNLVGELYESRDGAGRVGEIRHVIWSDHLICGACGTTTSFWEAAVRFGPARLESEFSCRNCGLVQQISEAKRETEQYHDSVLNRVCLRRRRTVVRVYGHTRGKNWERIGTMEDQALGNDLDNSTTNAPKVEIPWGDLYRSGYHEGLTHAHHFYTPRNWAVLSACWQEISAAPTHLQESLRALVLSFNATHATNMTRVVVKREQKDLVLTGAQPGVLYVSGLPVEKNLLLGIERKIKTFGAAFAIMHGRTGATEICGSSRNLELSDRSIDYVFTDPPFGDFIPYAEVNFLNELWLGSLSNRGEEITISRSQSRNVETYSRMLREVFSEVNRVLKDTGRATVVYHSAKADIWNGFQDALSSFFSVRKSSVLDKQQGSFKQVIAGDSVKGDILLLLGKRGPTLQSRVGTQHEDLIGELVSEAELHREGVELTPERLYSRYVSRCLEFGISVSVDASHFYSHLEKRYPDLIARVGL